METLLFIILGIVVGVAGMFLALWILYDGVLQLTETEDDITGLELDLSLDSKSLMKRRHVFLIIHHFKGKNETNEQKDPNFYNSYSGPNK